MIALPFLKVFILVFLANITVYVGIFFMNAGLLPETLSDLYAKTSFTVRVVISLITFFTVGNILFAKAFEWFDPVLVAPLNIVAFVFLQVLIAVLVNKTAPPLMIVPALSLVMAGSYWVYTLLNTNP